MNPHYTADTFADQPADFRIGAVFSDGMWYNTKKVKTYSKASFEEINDWIKRAVEDRTLIAHATGQSFRMPTSSCRKWHEQNNIELGTQIIKDIFPARIWDGYTESEGFLNAPLRELGAVSFRASPAALALVKQRLEGVAKIRSQDEQDKYKAFCLSASYVSEIIEKTLDEMGEGKSKDRRKTYARQITMRRELVDFSPEFAQNLVMFYKKFSKTLVRKERETIKIFFREPEDQESQVMAWVLDAIEKYDENSPIPFPGYLNAILKKRPYDLPTIFLGKDLSEFQRDRSKVIKKMREDQGKPEDYAFSSDEVADAMRMSLPEYHDLESQHKRWIETRRAIPLMWDESPEEKMVNVHPSYRPLQQDNDTILAAKISRGIIDAAIKTGMYEDALKMMNQVQANEIDMSSIKSISPEFIASLGDYLGVD